VYDVIVKGKVNLCVRNHLRIFNNVYPKGNTANPEPIRRHEEKYRCSV
jgi:hypothetical protein